MNKRRSMARSASIFGVSVLLAGCLGGENGSEETLDPVEHDAAISAMQQWTEFCDKADPESIVERLGVVNLELDEDVFGADEAPDGAASGRCGGTFETAPGNGGQFQVALRAHASDAEARESLEEWRASTAAQKLTPEFEVGTAESDLWLTQSGGVRSDIDGSVLHGFYRITITIGYPVHEATDDCGGNGFNCMPDPQDTLVWLEKHYLPGLNDAVDSALPEN